MESAYGQDTNCDVLFLCVSRKTDLKLMAHFAFFFFKRHILCGLLGVLMKLDKKIIA